MPSSKLTPTTSTDNVSYSNTDFANQAMDYAYYFGAFVVVSSSIALQVNANHIFNQVSKLAEYVWNLFDGIFGGVIAQEGIISLEKPQPVSTLAIVVESVGSIQLIVLTCLEWASILPNPVSSAAFAIAMGATAYYEQALADKDRKDASALLAGCSGNIENKQQYEFLIQSSLEHKQSSEAYGYCFVAMALVAAAAASTASAGILPGVYVGLICCSVAFSAVTRYQAASKFKHLDNPKQAVALERLEAIESRDNPRSFLSSVLSCGWGETHNKSNEYHEMKEIITKNYDNQWDFIQQTLNECEEGKTLSDVITNKDYSVDDGHLSDIIGITEGSSRSLA